MNRKHLFLTAMALSATVALAQTAPSAVGQHPPVGVDGPAGPIQPITTIAPPASTGVILQEQALSRLRAGFDRADVGRTGTLTLEQAQRGGLGYITQHFDEIDAAHTGKVRFEDVRRYLLSHQQ